MVVVYFDTNVYTHIYSNAGLSRPDLQKLEDGVASGRLCIITSDLVFDETISAVLSNQAEAMGRIQLIQKLARKVVQPNIDFTGVVTAYAIGRKVPKVRFESLQKINRFIGILPPDGLQSIATEAQLTVQRRYEHVREVYKTKIFPEGIYVSPDEVPTFPEYWVSEAEAYVRQLAEMCGVSDQCMARGLKGLLEIRPVRIATLCALSYTYANLFEGRQHKRGDLRDMQHALLSSPTEALISQDRTFRRVLNRIQIPDYAVMSLQELLGTL
jgi:hypothetical protein